jgi:lysyl-tRNA synthetase class 2
VWQPTATIKVLQKRAEYLKKIRDFFAARKVLEIDVPCLSQGTVTDPYIQSIPALYQEGNHPSTLYLQTSPEYYMKRLLAAGSGDIFTLCKSFRNGEAGRLHNPEFTMLEWYRLDFDDDALMDEIDALIQLVLQCGAAERYSYHAIFQKILKVDLAQISIAALEKIAADHHLNNPGLGDDHDAWLLFLFSHLIEPKLIAPTFVYDFPQTQAALARIKPNGYAARFELYIRGLEIANGFWELTDAKEQALRFQRDQKIRAEKNLPPQEADELFLSALKHGLPECAGVALGVDRLIMLTMGKTSIKEVMAFIL